MTPSPEELAEDTMAYLLPGPSFEPRERDGYVYVRGSKDAYVARVRRVDVEAVRAEARADGAHRVHWWLGWSAPGPEGLPVVPDDPPSLTGLTCVVEPPAADGVQVRVAEPDEVVALEAAVWGGPPPPLPEQSEVERSFAAVLDGRVVGAARAVEAAGAVALMGGVVLPEARGRGVYRALVRARWDFAVSRGKPCLVTQAGALSTPILEGIGFVRHGEVRLYVDLGVGSSHGDD